MKFNIFFVIFLPACLLVSSIHTEQAEDLQALKTERELRQLVKVKLHGEPLEVSHAHRTANKTVAFSPDGKHLAVAYTPGPVIIYDITAEKAKRFDSELEKMKQSLNDKQA